MLPPSLRQLPLIRDGADPALYRALDADYDLVGNVNAEALNTNADAIAHLTAKYAVSAASVTRPATTASTTAAIAGRDGDAAASYEARAFDVRSGMPLRCRTPASRCGLPARGPGCKAGLGPPFPAIMNFPGVEIGRSGQSVPENFLIVAKGGLRRGN